MSILTNTFAGGTDVSVFKAWFEENASDFFDEFTADTDTQTLQLSKDGSVVLELASPTVKFYTLNGGTYSGATSGAYIYRLTKTSCGIGISICSNSVEKPYGIFITKTNSGAIGCAAAASMSGGTVSYYFLSQNTINYSAYNASNAVTQTEITSLCPIVCQGTDEYLENCFFTPFSQYKGTACTLVIDGVKYLYNGAVALRE